MGKRTFALLCALLCLRIAFITSPMAGSRKASPVKVGVIAPLSGPFSSGGKAFLKSVQIALEEVNRSGGILGNPVSIVEGDSEGKVGKARNEALRLIDRENVHFLIGAYLSEETLGVMEVAAQRGTVLLVPISATEEITRLARENPSRYRYVFRTGYSISRWAEMISNFLYHRNVEKTAFIGASIKWNRELASYLKTSLEQKGIRMVLEDFYSPRNPIVKPILMKLEDHSPQWVVLGDPGKNSIEVVKKIEEEKIEIPLLSVGGTLADTRVVKELSPSVTLYALASTYMGNGETSNRFFERFRKKYGYYPSGYSDTLPGDALRILAGAVNLAGNTDADAVIETLESGSFPGVAGVYTFDGSHQAQWGTKNLPGVILKWEGESFRIVHSPK